MTLLTKFNGRDLGMIREKNNLTRNFIYNVVSMLRYPNYLGGCVMQAIKIE
jgi:hypothetical protein